MKIMLKIFFAAVLVAAPMLQISQGHAQILTRPQQQESTDVVKKKNKNAAGNQKTNQKANVSQTGSAQQAQPEPSAGNPLEITAEETLEWRRNERQYVARGHVIVRQGNVEIYADVLTADYKETASAAFDIYRLKASGNVIIRSQGNEAQGDEAIYDVAAGMATMTGKKLRLTSPDQTVTARDSFEYFVNEGRLSANGDAHVTRGEDSLRSDGLAAIFAQDARGQRQLSELTASGKVVITTPNEVLRGERAHYAAATNVAELTGGVKIERGPNVLEGEKAEVDLTTNVSRMIGGTPAAGGRVRGVFYPGTEKSATQGR